jgi:hypothetical protein
VPLLVLSSIPKSQVPTNDIINGGTLGLGKSEHDKWEQ